MKEFKCWKRKYSNKISTLYVYTKEPLRTIHLSRATNGYGVLFSSKGGGITLNTKKFKSKLQSLKFAENYMKRNDEC